MQIVSKENHDDHRRREKKKEKKNGKVKKKKKKKEKMEVFLTLRRYQPPYFSVRPKADNQSTSSSSITSHPASCNTRKQQIGCHKDKERSKKPHVMSGWTSSHHRV